MSTLLRRLGTDPFPELASRSFLGFRNFVIPGVPTAADLEASLVASISRN